MSLETLGWLVIAASIATLLITMVVLAATDSKEN